MQNYKNNVNMQRQPTIFSCEIAQLENLGQKGSMWGKEIREFREAKEFRVFRVFRVFREFKEGKEVKE